MPIHPDKADPELVIYADAVLPFPVAMQGLKHIRRWQTEVVKIDSDVQELQFFITGLADIRPETLWNVPGKDGQGLSILEGLYHRRYVSHNIPLRKE